MIVIGVEFELSTMINLLVTCRSPGKVKVESQKGLALTLRG